MQRARPRGLTLALLACTVLYGIYPLVEGGFFLIVTLRMNEQVQSRLALTFALGVALLLLMIPAWLGRPPQIRLIVIVAVLGLMLLNLAFVIGDMTAQNEGLVLDSLSQSAPAVDTCSLLVQIIVPLYVIWYLSRYPSRQYYQG